MNLEAKINIILNQQPEKWEREIKCSLHKPAVPNVQFLTTNIDQNQYEIKKYTFLRKGIETKYRLLEDNQIIAEGAPVELLLSQVTSKIKAYHEQQSLLAFEKHEKEKQTKKPKKIKEKQRVYEPEPEEDEQEQERTDGQEQKRIDEQKQEIPSRNKYAFYTIKYTRKTASYIYSFLKMFAS